VIQNPVNPDFTTMRRSMAPLLFANVHENLKRRASVKFFEIAKTYRKSEGAMTESKKIAGVVSHGSATEIRMLLDGLFGRL
jgi:phenylalanyl-tRNA synthetase beta subunit